MAEKQETILVVDDEAVVRELLYQSLSQEGYLCETAGDADQALDRITNVLPALVLLDINMPGKSGMELLPEIIAKYPDTAVIMVTAVSNIETAIKLLKMGAYDYVIKPINLNVLTVSIDRALDRRRLILENRSYQLHLEEKVEEQTRKIRSSFLNAIAALACALEAKDKYTSGHSQRVTEIAVAIAQKIDMPRDMVEKIRLAGLIHDIGKIGIRESVLDKPGKLTDEEYQHIKSHPELGERILAPIVEDREIMDMVRHHHERYDGRGYPDGLEAEQIPAGARIMAVADSYDAMTSDRPYRQAMSAEEACAEIQRCRDSQFDTDVVDAFLKTVNATSPIV